MEALDENDLTGNTLVIYTSDNGPWLIFGNHGGSAEPLREGKGTSWEGGVRVPAIMHWPGHIPSGAECAIPLMTIDLLPTIARVTNSKLPDNTIDGMDVWDVLSGTPGAKNPHSAYFIYYRQNELQAMISGEWKLVFPHQYRSIINADTGRDGLPGTYKNYNVEEIELYHLTEDISESVNVATDHPEMVQALVVLADSCRSDIGDALLGIEGRNNRPPGIVENQDKDY